MKTLKHLFTAVLLLCGIIANAQTFTVDGIDYKIIDGETVEVKSSGSSKYAGDIVIPEIVSINSLTIPSQSTSFTSSNSNSVRELGTYTFYAEAGSKLSMDYNITTAANGGVYLSVILDNNTICSWGETSSTQSYKTQIETTGTHTIKFKVRTSHDGWGTQVSVSNIIVDSNADYRVAGIGSNAFSNCSDLTSITLSNSITSIGNSAFSGCTNLEKIELPNSVTSIGNSTFSGCTSLEKIKLPNSVTSIGNSTFEYCINLVNLEFPESLTNIGELCFADCANLSKIAIPEGVTTIGASAFKNCHRMACVIVPNSITTIGDYAFYNCSNLKTVVNSSDLTLSKGNTSNGYVAYYADKVIDAEYGFIENEFVFAEINSTNNLVKHVTPYEFGVYEDCSIGSASGSMYSTSKTYTFEAKEGDMLTFNYIFKSNSLSSSYSFSVQIDSKKVISLTPSSSSYKEGYYITSSSYKHIFDTEGTHNVVATVTKLDAYNDAFGYIKNMTVSTPVEKENMVLPNNCKGEDYVVAESTFAGLQKIRSVEIPAYVTGIKENAFNGCTGLTSITSRVEAADLFVINSNVFEGVDKNECKLYVPAGAELTYATTDGWKDFIDVIAEALPNEVTVTIGKYGSATYCSPYSLDFSNVEGLKAYTAAGYNKSTQVVTLLRVHSAERGTGLFLKGAPGVYTVPVIEESDDYTINLLVGTLRPTTVNAKSNDGEYHNFKYTVIGDSNTPEFYQFEDGSTLGANKAYLQLPASLFPAAAKSIRARFDEGAFTDIDDVTTYNEEGICYDLQGRAVEDPTNGIYIINGKKVIVNK